MDRMGECNGLGIFVERKGCLFVLKFQTPVGFFAKYDIFLRLRNKSLIKWLERSEGKNDYLMKI